MAHRQRRKSLRERVEARKKGLPEETAPTPAARDWRLWLSWTGIGLQVAGLVLLIIEIVLLFERDFLGIDYLRLGIYTIVFFLGRVLQLVVSFTRR